MRKFRVLKDSANGQKKGGIVEYDGTTNISNNPGYYKEIFEEPEKEPVTQITEKRITEITIIKEKRKATVIFEDNVFKSCEYRLNFNLNNTYTVEDWYFLKEVADFIIKKHEESKNV